MATCGSQRKKGQEGTALSWFLVTNVSCHWHADVCGNSAMNFPHWSMSKNNEKDTRIQWFLATSKPLQASPRLEVLSLTTALPGEDFQVSHLSCMLCDILLMEEIRDSPVEVGSLSHNLRGFIHPTWCRIYSIYSVALVIHTSQ